MDSDKITTIIGLVGGASAIANQYGIAPQYTGTAAAIAGTLLGYFANKKVGK